MRSHGRWLLPGAWLAACGSPDKAPLPVGGDFPAAATTDSSDSGAVETGGPDRPGATLTVVLDTERPNVAVNLHSVVLGTDSDAPFELADGVQDATAYTIDVEPPIDRWITDLDSETRGFLALPFAYVDDDGNGVHTPEEQYLGLSVEGVAFIDGEPGAALAAAGFAAGWNGVTVDLETAAFSLRDGGLDGLPLAPQLIAQDRFLLEAPLELAAEGHRVALVPGTVFTGEVTGPLMFDQAASATVQVAIDGPPPDEHLQDYGADETRYRDWRYAVESLVVYADTDASGGFTTADDIVGSVCAMGVSGLLQHTSEADKAFEALHLVANDIIPAWSLYLDLPDGERYMRLDDVGPITLSDSCLP